VARLRILIWGGRGRLGRATSTCAEERGHTIVALVTRGSTPPPAEVGVDVVIDVSGPDAFGDVVATCRSGRSALVECVSNLPPTARDVLRGLATEVPVLRAENLAVGHYLQERLVRALGGLVAGGLAHADASVWERHPTTKAHRPSASALRIAAVWEETAGRSPSDVASLRGGLPVSDHALMLTLPGASLSIEHRVTDITAAATGAVLAAEWVVGRKLGFYAMSDVYDSLSPKFGVNDGPSD
jgi:4-hydroxy-tetrahydrodipicolinate reductase